jgi:hypothetical protein
MFLPVIVFLEAVSSGVPQGELGVIFTMDNGSPASQQPLCPEAKCILI